MAADLKLRHPFIKHTHRLPNLCDPSCLHFCNAFPYPPPSQRAPSCFSSTLCTLHPDPQELLLCLPVSLYLLHQRYVRCSSWLLLFLKNSGYSGAFIHAASLLGPSDTPMTHFLVSVPMFSPQRCPHMPHPCLPLPLPSFPPVHKELFVDPCLPVGSTHHTVIYFASMFTAEVPEPRTVPAHSRDEWGGHTVWPLPCSLTPPPLPGMVAAEQRYGLLGAAACIPVSVQSKCIMDC